MWWELIRIPIITGIISAVVCAALAPLRGRHFVFWLAAGLLINFVAIVLLLCLPDLRYETGFRVRVENENRRLREQLRQERMKSEVFRQYTARRLDAHDAQLGVDTRAALRGAGAPGGYLGMMPQPALPFTPDAASAGPMYAAASAPLPAAARQWYYEANNQTLGPVNEHTLRMLAAGGEIDGNTLVWAEHLDDWTALARVPEFAGNVPMVSVATLDPVPLNGDAPQAASAALHVPARLEAQPRQPPDLAGDALGPVQLAMTNKIAGQLQFDGLLEGPMLDEEGFEKKLRAWVLLAGEIGLRMELEIDGAHFSLLADNTPLEAGKLGADAAQTVTAAVNELLKLFPPRLRARAESTLRSVEYTTDSETQTLFVVAPDGTLAVQQRTVDAQTHAAPTPRSPLEIARLVTMGLAIAMVLLLISAFFVDYRALFHDMAAAAVPVKQPITVDASAFAPYFTAEGRNDGRSIMLTLRRTALFPTSDAAIVSLEADPPRFAPPAALSPAPPPATSALQAATTAAGLTVLQARLALNALARGYMRCEYFDAQGHFVCATSERIKELRDRDTIEINLAPPAAQGAPVAVGRVMIAY